MSKQIIFSDDARKKMQEWVKKLADAVRVTMWPRWRNVILWKKYWWPVITNDWVTIAKEIELEDAYENMWAQMVKEVASKTNDIAWDGTTTATVLADAMITEWMKHLVAWVNPMLMKSWIDIAVIRAVEELEKIAVQINSREEIAQVATNSAQNEEVWNLIADVIETIWNDWVITVEDWKTIWLEKEVVEWMQFDNGYISPYMVTDTQRMEAISESAKILITDQKISSIQPLLALLENVAQSGKKDLVIIAEDIEWEALTSIVLSKLRGSFNIIWVKAPWFWDRRKEMLKDIAVLTWWTVISEELWMKIDTVELDQLWEAKKVIVSKDNTTIVDWSWTENDIENRVSQLKLEHDQANSDFDKEKIAERIWKLTSWVAVIKVWAATEVEAKEKKHRIEDALSATRAALAEWIVAGWWTALVRAWATLEELKWKTHEEQVWIDLVKVALNYPIKQIADNWGFEWAVVFEKVSWEKWNTWFNALSWEYEDLVKNWIIDPKKVTRSALQNAASAASMFLTTEAAIADLPEKDNWWWDAAAAAAAMWGMGWMWGMGF